MAEKIRTLGPGLLTIGETSSQKDVAIDATNVTLTPSNDSEDADNYLDGHSEGGAVNTTWEMSGNIGEDYSMDGIQVWALNNGGKTMPFEFVPNKNGGLKLKGTLTVQPIAFGGDVKTNNKVDFTFPVITLAAEAYTSED